MSERVSSEDLAELEQLWTEAYTKVFGAEYTAAEGRQASDNFHAAIESVWPQLVAELRALRATKQPECPELIDEGPACDLIRSGAWRKT